MVKNPWLPTRTAPARLMVAEVAPVRSLGLTRSKVRTKKPSRSKLTFLIVDVLLPAVAESIGIPLTDDVAAREVAEQATFRIRTLLQTAQKYSMHAKRRKMNAEDLDLALKAQGQEPLYGLCAAEHIPFRSVGLFSRRLQG